MGNVSRHHQNDGVKALYAEWLRLPASERKKIAVNDKNYPNSKAAFAKKPGVSTVALWKWEQDPKFRKLVHTRALGTILTAEETEKAIAVLKARAFEGNITAVKLLLTAVGLLNRVKDAQPEEEDIVFSNWSEEGLASFLESNDDDSNPN